jgi:hypothetical protein
MRDGRNREGGDRAGRGRAGQRRNQAAVRDRASSPGMSSSGSTQRPLDARSGEPDPDASGSGASGPQSTPLRSGAKNADRDRQS